MTKITVLVALVIINLIGLTCGYGYGGVYPGFVGGYGGYGGKGIGGYGGYGGGYGGGFGGGGFGGGGFGGGGFGGGGLGGILSLIFPLIILIVILPFITGLLNK